MGDLIALICSLSVVEFLDDFVVVSQIPLNDLQLSQSQFEALAWLVDVVNLGQVLDELRSLIVETSLGGDALGFLGEDKVQVVDGLEHLGKL